MANLLLTMPSLTQALENLILTNWPATINRQLHYCIGLSGGIDSIVLLKLFSRLREQYSELNLSAIHVNHGLSNHAQHWEQFCQTTCQQLAIPLQIKRAQVTKIPGQGLENSARRIRYQAYHQSTADVIILAHHQNDQIETMLSQLLRGSELHNLAAMRAISERKGKLLWRPLLNCSKKQLLDYAQQYQLRHIEDLSNQDNQYLRNYIRNQVMPLFLTYDAQIKSKLAQSVIQFQQLADELDAIGHQDLIDCYLCSTSSQTAAANEWNDNTPPLAINLAKFQQLSRSRQFRLLNLYLKNQHLPLPGASRLYEFIRQVHAAAPDRHPSLQISLHQQLQRSKQSIRLIAKN